MPTPNNATDTEIGPPTRRKIEAGREKQPGFLRRAAAAGLNRLANIIGGRRNQAAGA